MLWRKSGNRIPVTYEFGQMYGAELDALDRSPLYALFYREIALLNKKVSLDSVSCSEFTFSTESDTDIVLLLNPMRDPRWRAYIDGTETAIEKTNLHFMGINVLGWHHTVFFIPQ